MRIPQALSLILLCVFFAACKAMPPRDFKGSNPVFDPILFFKGHTVSSGVIENRSGKPMQEISTRTEGKMKDNRLVIEQDLVFEKHQRHQHRSWQIVRLDEHHLYATANDIIGTAHGQLYGPMFQWSFRLKDASGNPLKTVRMSQCMYAQPDGKSVIIRTIIRKAGIIVVAITEQFCKTD